MSRHIWALLATIAALLAMLQIVATPHPHAVAIPVRSASTRPYTAAVAERAAERATPAATPPTTVQDRRTVTTRANRGVRRTPAATGPHGSCAPATQDTWTCIANCENHGDYGRSGNPSHFGRYQFDRGTWAEYGGNPATWGTASAAEQDQVFARARAAGHAYHWTPYDPC